MTAFLYSFDGSLHCIDVDNAAIGTGACLKKFVSRIYETAVQNELWLSHNGRHIHDDQRIVAAPGDVLQVCMRLPGGKGGFGSMLRALGAQIEKTTNREACRDLSGRRMRDVNDEKKIADWVNQQAEREREAAKRKQEKLERLKQGPAHKFDDSTYTKQIQGNAEMINSALQQGLKAASATTVAGPSSSSGKRRAEQTHQTSHKKKRLWLGLDDLDSDEDEETAKTEGVTSQPHTSTTSTCTTTTDSDTAASKASSQEDSPSTAKETSPSTETHSHDDSATVQTETTENSPGNTPNPAESTKDRAAASVVQDGEPICLANYETAKDLEVVGMDCLKSELMSRGLKCGGTLQQRAQRLFATKNVPLDKLDPSLFAKAPNGRKNGKK